MSQGADTLEDIRAFNQHHGPRCTTGIALNAMDPRVRDKVLRATQDPTIENKAIVRWLQDAHDIDMSVSSFQRHANGECRCGR
jgi:hypothetical protein